MGSEPVYRGMSIKFFNENDYKHNSILYWPRFSSTTRDKAVSLNFAKMDIKDDFLIFEIYLSKASGVSTNICLPDDWSFFKSEQEVLLLPFFQFQVVATRHETNYERDTRIVTLVEIPE